jgi:alpha-tubulin suppressor-like RCC1 family protein
MFRFVFVLTCFTSFISAAADVIVEHVAAGGSHTCALTSTKLVKCWGYGAYGGCGYNNTNDVLAPAAVGYVDTGGNVSQLAAGAQHTCALTSTGLVKCWGYGGYGQLGYNYSNDVLSPATVGYINIGDNVTQVIAGGDHTCALTSMGLVKCWGYGSFGVCGYNNTINTLTPASVGYVNIGEAVTRITAGFYHTCALTSTGLVKCWGYGGYGQLGYNSTTNVLTPATVGYVNINGNASQITAGTYHTCALTSTGLVKCWGYGGYGQLGYNSTAIVLTPASVGYVNIGGNVSQITAGDYHTCALTTTGLVKCWGQGFYGQLGYGIATNVLTPATMGYVNVGGNVTQIAAGNLHTCVLTSTGLVNCWGAGGGFNSGQLGYGDTNPRYMPGGTVVVYVEPSPSPSISFSVTPTASASPTSTGTRTASAMVTPSASTSILRSPSVTMSNTGTLTSTVSITPSATPHAALSSAYVRWDNVSVCGAMEACLHDVAWLHLRGVDIRSACIGGQFIQQWTSASLQSIFVCNDTDIIASFTLMEDPGPWLWYTAPIRVTTASYTSNAVWVNPLRPLVTTSTLSLDWGARVSFSGVGIGLLGVSAAFLAASDAAGAALPCLNVTVTANNLLSCTLRFMSTKWLHNTMQLIVGLNGVLQAPNITIPLQSAWMLQTAPQAVSVHIPAVLPLSGASGGSFELPQSPWSAEELQLAHFPITCATYIGPYRRDTPCPEGTNVAFTPPAGWGVDLLIYFELNGVLNISVGTTSFAHAGVKQITPSVVSLKPSIPGDVIELRLELADAGDGPLMQNVSIAGAPCVEHSQVGTMYKCTMLASHLQNIGANLDVLPLAVQFMWASQNVTVTLPGSIIVRPTLTSVTPSTVSPGSMLVIFGSQLCGAQACTLAAMKVMVGVYECSGVNVISDVVLTCTMPTVDPTIEPFPNYNVTIETLFGARARLSAGVTYPSSGYVQAAAPLPTMFIPSDESAPWPLPAPISVQVRSGVNLPHVDGAIVCSLTTTTPGALLLPITMTNLNKVRNISMVDFGRVGIQISFSKPSVSLAVACSSEGSDLQSTLALTWEVRPWPLRLTTCSQPPLETQSQQSMPSWSVGLYLQRNDSQTDALPTCDGWTGPPLPPITCALSATSPTGASAVLQNNNAILDATTAQAVFDSVIIGGETDVTYSLSTRCSIGSIAIPPTLNHEIRITGCAAGLEPSGALCVPCASSMYSDGGSFACRGCPPAGAACSGGILTLQANTYRHPSQRGIPLDERASLYECPIIDACLVNNSARAHYCAVGSAGVLCGTCDEENDYSFVDSACTKCLPSTANKVILAIAVLCAVGAVGVLVLRKSKSTGTSGGAIAVRILVTHIQATGAIKSFNISGSQLFKRLMSWTDMLSPAIISQGPAQCALRPSFPGVFYATMLAPVLACTCAVCLLITGVLFQPREGVSLLQSAKVQWREVLQQRRIQSVFLLMCQLAYMPIVSACLNVFHCTPAIEGVRYLVSDLRLACEGDTYTVLAISAGVILFVVGIGFPAVILFVLSIADPALLDNPTFRATWGFLYDGYRRDTRTMCKPVTKSRRCVVRSGWFPWWESVVLLRKAGIVLLGRLVDVPMLQVTLLSTLIALSFAAHSSYNPYESMWFQRAETVSLLCILISTHLSIAASQLPIDSGPNIAVTVVMLGINFITIVVLLALVIHQRLFHRLQSVCYRKKHNATVATPASAAESIQSEIVPPRRIRSVHLPALDNASDLDVLQTLNPLKQPRAPHRGSTMEFGPLATKRHILMDTYAGADLQTLQKT